ncbi:MAG: Fe-S cluster assembly protein HesB [Acidimicrobiia bacterium]|nr:Fe-S cluster assembly protein HesB [Acidimicrobiia bacterium]
MKLPYTDNDAANELLENEPLAFLIGMLLDQQIKIEQAFLGPYLLKERLGGELVAKAIASMDTEDLVEIFREKPALHRYPANMAKRTQVFCDAIATEYGGDAARVWSEATDGADLNKRLLALPGFGKGKVSTSIAILGKRLGVTPPGWEKYAPDHMTLADVTSFDDILIYREHKRQLKADAKAKS